MDSRDKSKGWYGIKKPRSEGKAGGRATFSIQEHQPNGKVVTLKSPELADINAKYKAGILTYFQAEKLVISLRDGLYRERDKDLPKLKFSEINLKIMDRYLDDRYSRKKKRLKDFYTYQKDLERALKSLEGLSIQTASEDALQDHIDDKFHKEPKKQRRIVARLNTILRYLGRDFQLVKVDSPEIEVRHLSLRDFKKILPFLDDDFAQICKVAFATGMRCGEVFGLKTLDVKSKDVIEVKRQMLTNLEVTPPKRNKTRKAYIIRDFQADVSDFARRSLQFKEKSRAGNFSQKVRRACRKAFPKDQSKWIVFHDLRHSYAIHLLSMGVPLNQVANCLGNSIPVCEKYYAGYRLSDEGLETIRRIMKPAKKRKKLKNITL